jgi:hypothetical protein
VIKSEATIDLTLAGVKDYSTYHHRNALETAGETCNAQSRRNKTHRVASARHSGAFSSKVLPTNLSVYCLRKRRARTRLSKSARSQHTNLKNKRAAIQRLPVTVDNKLLKTGEPSRARTCDPLIKSQLLDQLSYRPMLLTMWAIQDH